MDKVGEKRVEKSKKLRSVGSVAWAGPEGSCGVFLEFGFFQKKGGGGMNIGGLAMQAFGGAVNYGFFNFFHFLSILIGYNIDQ